jgi:hypothetical protein
MSVQRNNQDDDGISDLAVVVLGNIGIGSAAKPIIDVVPGYLRSCMV